MLHVSKMQKQKTKVEAKDCLEHLCPPHAPQAGPCSMLCRAGGALELTQGANVTVGWGGGQEDSVNPIATTTQPPELLGLKPSFAT